MTSLQMSSVSSNRVLQAAKRLDEAANMAVAKVSEFASIKNPYEESQENPWCDPDHMMSELKQVRDDLMAAWHALKKAYDEEDESAKQSGSFSPVQEDDFRAQYMDMVTEAFADVLEGMREAEGDQLDVDVLVDCLQSGMDLLNEEDRDGFFEAFEKGSDGEDEGSDKGPSRSVHEMRRHELGLDLPVSG